MRKRYLHDNYDAGVAFWDRTWEGAWQSRHSASLAVLPRLVACVAKYLSPGMSLLEGGCGDGRYVTYFNSLGVNTIGVDFAIGTIDRIKIRLPALDVRVGDIRSLDFPDRYFDAYYSGGVIEHCEGGISPQVAEARRVLKDGGYFFVDVPYMNLARQCAGVLFTTRYKVDLDGRSSYHREHVTECLIEQPPVGFHFHEYVLTSSEMRRILVSNGFTIVAETCLSSDCGLCDIQWYRHLIGAGQAKRTLINKICAAPLRGVRYVEAGNGVMSRAISGLLGVLVGNLKLYVCTATK